MSAYSWQALDAKGKRLRGVIEGNSERHARTLLRQQGLKPIQLRVAGESSKGEGFSLQKWFPAKVGFRDLCIVTRQLAVLLQAGLPLVEALQATARQCRKDVMKNVLLKVRTRVTEGVSFAKALGEHPKVFNNLYRALVDAGERSGHLGPVLERLAEYTESRQQTQQQLKSAMTYPIMLVIVAVLVIGAMMTVVVPKLITIFENTSAELPGLTVALIATSNFLQEYWFYLLAVVPICMALWRQLLKDEQRRWRFHQLLLKTPFVGELIRGLETARFASTLSILTQSGVPLLDALRISRQVFSNLPLRDTAEVVAEEVSEGGSLYRSMEQSGEFPPMMVQMVASGEASGNLESMLERAAGNQERELSLTMDSLMSVFQPLMVLIMAGLVLTIVMAVLLPMFELNDLVQ